MATGSSVGDYGRSAPVAITIGGSLSRDGRRQRRRGGQRLLLCILCGAVLFAVLVAVGCLLGHRLANGGDDDDVESLLDQRAHLSSSRKRWEEGLPEARQQQWQRRRELRDGDNVPAERQRRRPRVRNNGDYDYSSGERLGRGRRLARGRPRGRMASIESVVRYLDELAGTPPEKLWDVFGMQDQDRGEDPFSLRELEGGRCPWSGEETVEWLPPRPHNSVEMAERYKANIGMVKGRRLKRMDVPYEAENDVAIWYEHMSKAGGTTFCGLAKSNMMLWQVPRYHCMPRKGELIDGRVGSWPNDELVEYLTEHRHAVVSNEWDPFSLEKLELSGRRLDGSRDRDGTWHAGPRLLFVTTLRDACDRLLSSYTFFALTVKKGGDGPTFDWWIEDMLRRARRYLMGSRSAFRANIGRMNHAVWRFSGGGLPPSRRLQEEDAGEWRPHFETAVRALAQHDLVLPMDVMTKSEGKAALSRLLGWDRFDAKGRMTTGDKDSGHVVTMGEIKNSNAREYFGKEKYRALWEDNWLDNILYLWCRAVFLARLHCDEGIVTPETNGARTPASQGRVMVLSEQEANEM